MATSLSAAALPNQIQQLLENRELHIEAIGKIDKTLAAVTTALGVPVAVTAPAVAALEPAPVTLSAKKVTTKDKKRSSFAVSAGDLVLAFVKLKKNPTTKEITQHLLSQGRTTSSVSNALSTLAKAKKLKRTPLDKGQSGSRYSLA